MRLSCCPQVEANTHLRRSSWISLHVVKQLFAPVRFVPCPIWHVLYICGTVYRFSGLHKSEIGPSARNRRSFLLCAPTAGDPAAMADLAVEGSVKRFAVLMTGHAPDIVIKKHGGLGEMFVHLLSDPGEAWDIFPVIEGKFPTDQELESYAGFVVTGSRRDAHGSEPWIERLCGILQRLHEKRTKVLGICFGHQVLSRALGGGTGRSDVGWELGLKRITVSEALLAKPYALHLKLPRVLTIMESHRDAISEVPPGGEILGWSEKTAIEIFALGEHVLGIQGHPEFGRDVAEEIFGGRLALGILTEEEVNAARKSMDEGQADSKAWQSLCKAFLKG